MWVWAWPLWRRRGLAPVRRTRPRRTPIRKTRTRKIQTPVALSRMRRVTSRATRRVRARKAAAPRRQARGKSFRIQAKSPSKRPKRTHETCRRRRPRVKLRRVRRCRRMARRKQGARPATSPYRLRSGFLTREIPTARRPRHPAEPPLYRASHPWAMRAVQDRPVLRRLPLREIRGLRGPRTVLAGPALRVRARLAVIPI